MSQTPRGERLAQLVEKWRAEYITTHECPKATDEDVKYWHSRLKEITIRHADELAEALRESATLQIMDEAFRERLADDARVVAHLRAVPVGKCACPVHKYLAESAPPAAPTEKPFFFAIETAGGDCHDGEYCVFGDLRSAQDQADSLNEELPESEWFKVVPLFRAANQPIAGPSELRDVLRTHWLHAIECNHADKMDTAHCACGTWSGEPHHSVGAALESWIDHVCAELDRAIAVAKPQPEAGRK